MFITFEGIDGAGKSTQAALLANTLEKEGYRIRLVDKEARPIKQLKRQLLSSGDTYLNTLPSFYLSLSDVAYALEHLLEPKEQEGFLIMSHRYIYSVLASAIAEGQSRELSERAVSLFRKPDIIILLNISPQTALVRKGRVSLAEAGGPRVTEKNGTISAAFLSYQSQVAAAYPALLGLDTELSSVVLQIDGEREASEVHSTVVEKVLARLRTHCSSQDGSTF